MALVIFNSYQFFNLVRSMALWAAVLAKLRDNIAGSACVGTQAEGNGHQTMQEFPFLPYYAASHERTE